MIVEGNPIHDLVLGLAPRAKAHAVEPFDLSECENASNGDPLQKQRKQLFLNAKEPLGRGHSSRET